MNARQHKIGIAVCVALLLVTISFVAMTAQVKGDLAATVSSVMLKAMARGYECHERGRTLADCQNEQAARWKAVNAGLPIGEFGAKP